MKCKQPTDAIIMTGYNLTKARMKAEEALEYVWQAHQCALQARSELVTEDGPYNVQFGEVIKAIAEAVPAMHAPAAAHTKARELSLALGFCEVTKEDFLKFGGGGGR